MKKHTTEAKQSNNGVKHLMVFHENLALSGYGFGKKMKLLHST